MFRFAALVSALTLAGCVAAHAASGLAVAVAVEQFRNAQIIPDALENFDPIGLLQLNLTGQVNRTSNGVVYTREQANTQPLNVYVHWTEESENDDDGPLNNTDTTFTVMTFDASYPGADNNGSFYLHWLGNNWTYASVDHDRVVLGAPETFRVAYQGPAPPAGTGPHRYVTLVFEEPDNFTIPSTPAQGAPVQLFDLNRYLEQSRLGSPLAGVYFVVEGEGEATVSVEATSSVDSTTLPQFTATPTGEHGDNHGTTSTAPAGSSPTNAAIAVSPSMGLGLFSMLLALIV